MIFPLFYIYYFIDSSISFIAFNNCSLDGVSRLQSAIFSIKTPLPLTVLAIITVGLSFCNLASLYALSTCDKSCPSIDITFHPEAAYLSVMGFYV